MSEQKLTAFERKVVGGLARKAGLAATLLDTWANLPKDSVQSARSLIDDAQLGITEENATRELLDLSVGLGLVDAVPTGFQPRKNAHGRFRRLAFALNAIDYYLSDVQAVQCASCLDGSPDLVREADADTRQLHVRVRGRQVEVS